VAAPPTPAEVQLAQRLRQLREEAHLTQVQVASLLSTGAKDVSSATISSWENRRTSALPPEESRLDQYALIAVTRHRPDSQTALPQQADLSTDEERDFQELRTSLHELWERARGNQDQEDAEVATYRSWFFDDDGPIAIICPEAPPEARGPLQDAQNPNYTHAHAYADLDALIELFGHIRAENGSKYPISFKLDSEVRADDLSGHLVLLGGVAWNELTKRLLRSLTRLPVRQFETADLSTGEIFAVGRGPEEQRFEPEWAPDEPKELIGDVGLFARVRNPYNSSRTLTLCNESYLAKRFGSDEYAVLMKIQVFQGEAVTPDLANSEYRLYEWPPEKAGRDRI
jgi:transcriptional regulator with XRE-family HTH domain